MKNITVYCASSKNTDPKYLKLAAEVGKCIADNGWGLVFGGTGMGAMLSLAEAVKKGGGHVAGIIPKSMDDKGWSYDQCDTLTIESDLRQRKKLLSDFGDVLLALPGGIGTFDELFEVMAAKQCNEHSKPIIIFNHERYYNGLLKQIEIMIEHGLAHKGFEEVYQVITTLEELTAILAPRHFDDPAET